GNAARDVIDVRFAGRRPGGHGEAGGLERGVYAGRTRGRAAADEQRAAPDGYGRGTALLSRASAEDDARRGGEFEGGHESGAAAMRTQGVEAEASTCNARALPVGVGGVDRNIPQRLARPGHHVEIGRASCREGEEF